MLYFAYKTYIPNTAPTNRFMAFVRGISEMGVSATICFFTPNSSFEKVEGDYKTVQFKYHWEKFPRQSALKKLWSLVTTLLFVIKLKKHDVVYIYGFPFLLWLISKIGRSKCYYEIDECPDVYITKTSFVDMTKDRLLKCLNNITGVIVISQALKDYFVEKGIAEKRISIVNMIVDSGRFKDIKKQPSEKYIAYCGTVSLYKDGVDQLLKAFAIFSRLYPEYKLYVIGNIPSSTDEKELKTLVIELGIESKVVFTGMISFLGMPQILKNAEILALARPNNIQAKYGFPTKLGEYLLTGNPVVVTRVGDIPQFLIDKESALLVEADKPALFAEQMSWVVNHPYESKLIGEKGKEIAMLHFDYLHESKKLYQILTKNVLI